MYFKMIIPFDKCVSFYLFTTFLFALFTTKLSVRHVLYKIFLELMNLVLVLLRFNYYCYNI